MNSGKDPENSLATIEQFEKEIRGLGLQPDVEKNFLVRVCRFGRYFLATSACVSPTDHVCTRLNALATAEQVLEVQEADDAEDTSGPRLVLGRGGICSGRCQQRGRADVRPRGMS